MRRIAALLFLLAACGGPPPPGDTLPGCRVDSDCDDGLFCNGTERCDPRTLLGCLPGTPPCAMGCDEVHGCVSCEPPDADADGARARACGGADCDDTSPLVLPGAPERCNGEDDDCDRLVDEERMDVVLYLDRDADGHGDPASPVGACTTLSAAAAGDDCDDGDPSVSPSAPERCNGLDDDCSGTADDAAPDVLCALLGVASASCDAGVCTIARCEAGRGDCNGRGDDGCEVDTTSDVRHCGACDAPCISTEGTPVCAASACELANCPDGRHVCGGRCVSDFSTDTCNTSCTPCPVPPAHGGTLCDGNSCRPSCDRDYTLIREPSLRCVWASPWLTDVIPSEGTFTEPWASVLPDYPHVLELPATTTEIRFTPVTDPRAEIAIDFGSVSTTPNVITPPIALAPGSNRILVHAVAATTTDNLIEVRRGALAATELDNDAGSLAATDTTLAVGSWTSTGGTVHVYDRVGDAWMENALLTAPLPALNDHFGEALAVDGDRIVIGAPGIDAGAVYVFRREGADWVAEARLGLDLPGEYGFGEQIALSGDVLAVLENGPIPRVLVFRRTGFDWAREAIIDGPPATGFGHALALSDGRLFVGDSTSWVGGAMYAGSVHVYAASVGWSSVADLYSPTPIASEYFGTSVAARDGWLVVGAPGAPGSVTRDGYPETRSVGVVYVIETGSWAHVRTLRAPFEWLDSGGDRLGSRVALADGAAVASGGRGAVGFEVDPTFTPTSVWHLAPGNHVAVTTDEFLTQSYPLTNVLQRYR